MAEADCSVKAYYRASVVIAIKTKKGITSQDVLPGPEPPQLPLRLEHDNKLNPRKDDLLSRSAKTYNSGDSLVVTDPTTNPPLISLSMGERTGSRVL